MAATRPTAETPAPALRGASIIRSIKSAGVESVVALPDIVTRRRTRGRSHRSGPGLVPVCKGGRGVLHLRGAVLLASVRVSFSTWGSDSINAIRVISVEYDLPVVMILGLQGMEPDRTPSQSDKLSVRIVEPICEAMELEYAILYDESDVAVVEPMINEAFEQSKPVAILIARSPE